MSILDSIREYGVGRLSHSAEALCPDGNESEGAKFLLQVRDAVIESVEYLTSSDGMSLTAAVEHIRDNGIDSEIADGAVPVYTHDRMVAFVDLGAYHEDLSEIGGSQNNMIDDAGVALYLMASRLVNILLYEIEKSGDEGIEQRLTRLGEEGVFV